MLSRKDLHLNFLKLPNDLLSYIISGTFYPKKKIVTQTPLIVIISKF